MDKFHFVSQRELAAGRTSATEDDEAIGKRRRRAVIGPAGSTPLMETATCAEPPAVSR
jgi:hypothetical protein